MLLGAAMAKSLELLGSGIPVSLWGITRHVAMLGLELAIAILVWNRKWAALALWGAVAIAVGGAALAVLGEGGCGCFGSHWKPTRAQHACISAIMGLAAIMGMKGLAAAPPAPSA